MKTPSTCQLDGKESLSNERRSNQGNDIPSVFDNSHGRIATWKYMMGQFARCAHAALKFSKKVPGFRKLSITEQISVIQNSMYPIVVTVLSIEFDVETERFNYFNFTEEERDTVWHFFPEFKQLLPTFINVGHTVQQLQLDMVETGFLCAIRLLCEEKSYGFQQLMLNGLRAYCKEKNATDNRADDIALCLQDLEKANCLHQAAVYSIATCKKYADLPMPELFQETFLND